jgi:SAM-dependent methyltransferase
VLDIGIWHLAAILSRNAHANVTAATLVTSEAFERHMRSVGVGVAICDLECGPLPAVDRSVDIVLCCEVIEHLDGDVRHMLAEARRVVRDEGLLLLTTPNHILAHVGLSPGAGQSIRPRDDPDYPFTPAPACDHAARAGIHGRRGLRSFSDGRHSARRGHRPPPLPAGRVVVARQVDQPRAAVFARWSRIVSKG